MLPPTMPSCLRFAERCPAPDGIHRPALLALVRDANGEPITIHRTFLGASGKADMENPRALMPGPLPNGSAIQLFALSGDTLGIAEGVETALAAADRFGIPVWSAINAALLAKWTPPPQVGEVWVFGDNDAKFGGQAAAFSLAHKLVARLRLRVQVHVPVETGRDWADGLPKAETLGGRDPNARLQSSDGERGRAHA